MNRGTDEYQLLSYGKSPNGSHAVTYTRFYNNATYTRQLIINGNSLILNDASSTYYTKVVE
jgi:hypothetical protein